MQSCCFWTSGSVCKIICLHSTAGRILKAMFMYTNQADGGTCVNMAFVALLLPRCFWWKRWTRIRWMWGMAFIWEKINAYWILARKPKEKNHSGLRVGKILKLILFIQYVKVWTLFGLITRPDESYKVWCVWVWSWSLDNEEALAHYGLLRHKNGLHLY